MHLRTSRSGMSSTTWVERRRPSWDTDKAIELEPTLANVYNQRSVARNRLGDEAAPRPISTRRSSSIPTMARRTPSERCRRSSTETARVRSQMREGDRARSRVPERVWRSRHLSERRATWTERWPTQQAIALGRIDAFAYLVRGVVRADRGDEDEARADLLRAIDLAPTAEFVAEVRTMMAEYGLD